MKSGDKYCHQQTGNMPLFMNVKRMEWVGVGQTEGRIEGRIEGRMHDDNTLLLP